MKARIAILTILAVLAPQFAGAFAGTLGNVSNNTSTQTFTVDRMYCSTQTAASNGPITTAVGRFWLSSAGQSSTTAMIYSASTTDGAIARPYQRLATSSELSITGTSEAARTYTFSGSDIISIAAGTKYWLCIHAKDPGALNFTISRANVTSVVYNLDTTYPTVAETIAPTATSSGPHDLYVNYTEGPTIQIIQSVNNYIGSTASSTISLATVTAGNMIFASMSSTNSGTAPTCSDNRGNVYTTTNSVQSTSGTRLVQCYAIATTTQSVTLTIGGTSGDKGGNAMEITGFNAANPFNASSSISYTSATTTPRVNITTTGSNRSLLIASFAEEQTATAAIEGIGWTTAGNAVGHFDKQMYMIRDAGTYLASLQVGQSSDRWVLGVTAINEAVAASPSVTPALRIQGGGMLRIEGGGMLFIR